MKVLGIRIQSHEAFDQLRLIESQVRGIRALEMPGMRRGRLGYDSLAVPGMTETATRV